MAKTAIVTGGLGALGRAVATELAAHGWRVAVVDRVAAPEAEPGISVNGGTDLTDTAAVEAAFARIAEASGGIGALVNVAGGFLWEPVEGGSADSFDRMYAINLRTAAIACTSALPHLLKSGGAIVNVGAAGAARPDKGMAAYAASKAGVRALTESLAEEMRGRVVRVNCVLPTILDTPANRAAMPDADPGQWVAPEAAAKAIAFLLSEEAGAITGASIPLSLRGIITP